MLKVKEDVETEGMLEEGRKERQGGEGVSQEGTQTDWLSIHLCSLCQFFSAAQFSLFFMSMFPLLKTLDPSNTEASFGLVIAMYSLAQAVSSPLVGWFSNCLGGRLRLILIGLECFMLAGNCLYFLIELFPSAWARNVLMVARFLVGIGAGNIGLFRGYVSMASTAEDRSKAIALVTSGHALGTTFGPAFQVFFSWLGFPGLSLLGPRPLHLSMFTAPALFAAILNIFNFVSLKCFFKENYVALIGQPRKKAKAKGKKVPSDDLPDQQQKPLPSSDRLALLLCYSMRLSQTLIFSNFQTLGASFAMLMFSWSATEVVRFGSLAHAAKGMVAFSVYLAYIFLDLGKRINERLICLCSLLGLLIFHVLTFSWPFLPEHVEMHGGQGKNPANSSANSLVPGCDLSQFDWCPGLKRVNGLLFNTLYALLLGLAFPNIHVAMNTLFSKIIGPRLQGIQQGLMQMAGGIGRLVGPLLVGYFYTQKGPRAVWLMEMGVILGMILLWSLAYRRLVPLRLARGRKRNKHPFCIYLPKN